MTQQVIASQNTHDSLLPLPKFDVGYREILVDPDGSVFPVSNCGHPNAIKIAIWFPIDKVNIESDLPKAIFHTSVCADGSDTRPITNIDTLLQIPMANEVPLLSTVSLAAKNAYEGTNLAIASNRKFPVIIDSHGLNSDPWMGSTAYEKIAEQGFIILSPFYKGTTYKDNVFRVQTTSGALTDNKLVRLPIMNFTVDWILSENNNPSSPFFQRVATNKIVAMGYSRGGEAVLTWGAEGLHPAIKAILVGQPLASVVELAKMMNITVPTMILAGSTGRNIAHYQAIYPAIATDPKKKYLIEIQGTAHLQIGDPCRLVANYFIPAKNAYLNSPFAAGLPSLILSGYINAYTGNGSDGCTYVSPAPIPTLAHDKVIDIYAMYVVAFMNTYGTDSLKHDAEHDASGQDNTDQGNKFRNYLTPQFAIDNRLPVIMINDGITTAPDYD